jgi:hypothetical protein
MSANNALKTTSNGHAGYVHRLSVLEDVADSDLLAYFVPAETLCITANFLHVIECTVPCGLELAELCLVAALRLLRLETKLDGTVAMLLRATNIEDVARSSLYNSNWDALPLRCKHLGHSQLLS